DRNVTGVQTCALPIFSVGIGLLHLIALTVLNNGHLKVARISLITRVNGYGISVLLSRGSHNRYNAIIILLRIVNCAVIRGFIQRSEERRVGSQSGCW